MENILQWVLDNWGYLATGTGFVAATTALWLYFKSKVLPQLLIKIVNIFAKVVSNLFGSNTEGEVIATELPIIGVLSTRLLDYAEQSQLDGERQLLSLKEKLSSPLYSAIEKMPYQQAFDYLYNKLKSKLSPEFIAILEAFDKVSA